MAKVGAPISLDGVAVHPDCWCVCLCYLHRAVKWLCVCVYYWSGALVHSSQRMGIAVCIYVGGKMSSCSTLGGI